MIVFFDHCLSRQYPRNPLLISCVIDRNKCERHVYLYYRHLLHIFEIQSKHLIKFKQCACDLSVVEATHFKFTVLLVHE